MRWSDKVKALMLERGITQEALAPILKVKTRGAVGHILTGRRQMSAHQVMALAKHFGVTVEDLVNDEEPDFNVIRLARAIESLPSDKKSHLAAVVDAFTKSLACEGWDGLERRKGGQKR